MARQPSTGNNQPDQAAETPLQRVVFVAPFGLGQKTTVWARILPLAQYIHRQGADVDILIPPWDTPAHSGLVWDDGGVRIDNVRLAGGPPAILGRMLRRVQRRRAQIVHIVKPVAYAGGIQTLIWALRKMGGIHTKLVLDVDDWEQAWASLNQRAWPVQRLIAWQENWGLTHCDGVTAASQWLMDEVHGRNAALPVCYIPNGLNPPSAFRAAATNSETSQPADNPPQILFFTRFMEIPPAWLGEFCAALFDRHATVVLNIAGSGIHPQLESDFKSAFHAHAAQTKLDVSRVRWLGHVRLDDLGSLYESSTCAIFPAKPTPLQQAKCSVRLATTLLHGVPSIATAVGEQIAYGRAGNIELVAPEATPQTFAHTVLDVLRNPQTLAARQQEARTHLLSQYNWSTLGARLFDFYGALLG